MNEKLLRIEAPHYVAGIVFKDELATKEAAPILKWMIGKEWNWVIAYLNSKGYNYQWKNVT